MIAKILMTLILLWIAAPQSYGVAILDTQRAVILAQGGSETLTINAQVELIWEVQIDSFLDLFQSTGIIAGEAKSMAIGKASIAYSQVSEELSVPYVFHLTNEIKLPLNHNIRVNYGHMHPPFAQRSFCIYPQEENYPMTSEGGVDDSTMSCKQPYFFESDKSHFSQFPEEGVALYFPQFQVENYEFKPFLVEQEESVRRALFKHFDSSALSLTAIFNSKNATANIRFEDVKCEFTSEIHTINTAFQCTYSLKIGIFNSI